MRQFDVVANKYVLLGILLEETVDVVVVVFMLHVYFSVMCSYLSSETTFNVQQAAQQQQRSFCLSKKFQPVFGAKKSNLRLLSLTSNILNNDVHIDSFIHSLRYNIDLVCLSSSCAC